MKAAGSVILLTLGMLLSACGGGGNGTGNITGSWSATLNNQDGTPSVYAFTTSFTQNSSTSVTVFNFKFNSTSDCFDDATTTETSLFTLGGDFNGNVTGTLVLNITSDKNNKLNLQGNINGKTISGTWSLTGSATCTGSGKFTMTEM